MGGADTEVDSATKEIVLIASTINAMSIRKTAQRHGIRTDASARYERGLPVELLDRGRALAVAMLVEMGAQVISGTRLGGVESPSTIIEVKPQKIDALLGIPVDPKDVIKHLQSLGFEVSGLAKLKVRVPWWRPDVTTASDVAEEVIKIVGLDALPATIPAWSPDNIQFDTVRAATDKVRELLRSSGLFELTTYSFVSEDELSQFGMKPAAHLKLKNPMSVEQAYMRSTLLPSLVKVMDANQRYAKKFGVSEISRVFVPTGKKGELPTEPYKVALAIFGNYFSAKSPLDLIARELRLDLSYVPAKHSHYYPGRQADIQLDGVVIGSVGQLHPRLTTKIKGSRELSFAEVNLEPLIIAANSHTYAPISRFPTTSRDLAVVLDTAILWADVLSSIMSELPGVKVSFQSRYAGDGIPTGKVSLALRLMITNMERTLTDAEADAVVDQVLDLLKKKFGATLRS